MSWTVEVDRLESPPPQSAADRAPARRKKARRWLRPWPAVVVIVGILLVWQFLIPLGIIPGVPVQYLSTPSNVFNKFIKLAQNGYTNTPLIVHFMASLLRALIAIALATVLGIPLGLLLGLNPTLNRFVGPLIGFLRPIPALAWIPIVVIWMGIGESSKIFVIFMTALLFVMTGAILGVRSVPEDFYLVAKNYGMKKWDVLWRIVFPRSLPQVIAGLRTATTVGWAVVVAAELIGASQGLGYLIKNAGDQFDAETVYIGIFLIGLVGVAFEYGFQALERRVLHWQTAR
jgi:taurine transport system permease protein